MTQNRYPGLKPFTSAEKHLFFGRHDDIENLYQKIRLEQIVVVYSKSGLGKSSLLNAGIIPKMQEDDFANAIPVRLGSYNENQTQHDRPLEKLKQALKTDGETSDFTPDKIIPNEDSIWYCLKKLQFIHRADVKPLVIIFDQFEELFTFPQEQVELFCEQLAIALRVNIPPNFKKLMDDGMRQNRSFLAKEELAFMNRKLQLKVVFAIRSDRMSLLNRITPYLPDILQNCYELAPLNIEQAKQAIEEPAKLQGKEFSTPEFSYHESTLEKITNSLKDSKNNIEAFQLQIVCRYCENWINKLKKDIVLPEDIGDIQSILENFYAELLENLHYKDTNEKIQVRKVLEEILIFEKEERRMLVYEGILHTYISEGMVKQLASNYIIRSEPYSSGGFSYELSHDTLVAPILKAYRIRRAEEERIEMELKQQEELRLAQEKAEKERVEREKEKRQQRRIIAVVLVAAVISLAFGIFGMVMYQTAKKEKENAQNNEQKVIKMTTNYYLRDANAYLQQKEYKVAFGRYKYLRDTVMQGETTPAIEKRIKECDSLMKLKQLYDTLLYQANSYYVSNEFEKVVESYSKALSTNMNNEKIKTNLKELQIQINETARDCIEKAEAIKAIDKKQEATERNNAAKMQALSNNITGIINKQK
jgi:hypothetical protein